MTPNTKPLFALVPQFIGCKVDTANLNNDGITGAYGTLITAPDAHLKISRIEVKANGSTVAGIVKIFVSDTEGTTFYLKDEILISAITPNATVASASNSINYPDFEIKQGQIIKVSTTISQSINVLAQTGTLGA